MNRDDDAVKVGRQTAQYSFPYHWLPHRDGDGWQLGRSLDWGLEYLGLIERVLQTVTDLAPASVLDVGCGDGRLLHEMLAAGIARATGVDLVEPAIGFAAAFNAGFGERLRLHRGDIRELPPAELYDVVVAMEVLEHIPDDAIGSVLTDIRERMAPGGRLVVSVPTTNRPVNPKHHRHYRPETLAAELDGFRLEHLEWVHRDCAEGEWLRRLVWNRLYVLRHRGLTRLVARRYHSRILEAGPDDGAHLLAVFSPAAVQTS